MNALLDVTRVQAQPDFTLLLEFDNGESRLFDMSQYIDQKPWVRLKEGKAFFAAFVSQGTVAWPGNHQPMGQTDGIAGGGGSGQSAQRARHRHCRHHHPLEG
jgi:hypothetical protein